MLKAVPPSLLAVLLAALAATAPAAAAPEDDPELVDFIRSHYTKHEVRIPMRDGARLFTAIYLPNDATAPRPILLNRTPYGVAPYGADRYRTLLGPSPEFAAERYIFVYQDVRGRFMSEGEFVDMRPHLEVKRSPRDVDESTDAFDTIEWLVAHVPGHNGKVGLWGLSYGGFYTSAGIIDSHPALAAASPSAPIADWFWDDMHRHGAFVLPLAFDFFASFGVARPAPTTEWPPPFDYGTPDGYAFFLELGPLANVNARHFKGEIGFWNELVAHPDYDDFWRSRNILPHLGNIRCAVMTVGGWFDTEDLYGPLATYRQIERANPGIPNTLVMGPWAHGGWLRTPGDAVGEASFGFATAEWYRERAQLPFFRHHLDGGPVPELPEALVFETGANRWRRFGAWPPAEAEPARLWLRAGGRLSSEPPPAGEAGADAYPSDPAKPVPYTMEVATGWSSTYVTEDQRFAARRPDVLAYRSEPLDEDLTVAGPITADLWVSTTGTDADFVVKIIDELPPDAGPERPDGPDLGGTQRLVRAEAFRGRYRESYSKPIPFEPDTPTRVSFQLHDVLHTWKRGHRVMVQVQSTWFPLVDRNPQRFVPNIFEATAEDFVVATHRVHRSADRGSSISFAVLPAPGLP